MTELANEWMQLTIWTGALLAACWGLDRALSSRVAPRARIVWYLPVFVRPFIPLDWTNPIGVVGHQQDALLTHTVDTVAPAASLGLIGMPVAPEPTINWLALIWVCGSVVLGARAARRWWLSRRTLHESSAWDVDPSVRVHPTAGPAVLGVLRPIVVIPAAMRFGRPETLQAALAHERAHISGRDAVLSAVLTTLRCLYWPVVPVVLATLRIRQLLELAADATAAGRIGRRSYGEALLAFADSSPRLGIAMGSSGARALRERIGALNHAHPSTPWRHIVATSGVALLMLAVSARAAETDTGVSLYTEVYRLGSDARAFDRDNHNPAFDTLLGARGHALDGYGQMVMQPQMIGLTNQEMSVEASSTHPIHGEQTLGLDFVAAGSPGAWEMTVGFQVPGTEPGIADLYVETDQSTVFFHHREDGERWLVVIRLTEWPIPRPLDRVHDASARWPDFVEE